MTERRIHIHHDEPGIWPLSWPMGITMLRLLLLPVFLYVLLEYSHGQRDRYRWLAVGIFAVMAITDKLDGYLARKLKQTSKLGMLLDPLADKLLILSSLVVLSFEWVPPAGFGIPRGVVAIVYAKDLVVGVGSLTLLSLVGHVTITPRPLGKLSTFLQLSMIIATLIAPDIQRWNDSAAWWLTRSLWFLSGAITAAAGVDYVILGFRQLAESKKSKASE
ncbi:MAG TPA: CDP-alcohol phosphatidyltransferase family protein [Tepidisphaeraceae bacterium]